MWDCTQGETMENYQCSKPKPSTLKQGNNDEIVWTHYNQTKQSRKTIKPIKTLKDLSHTRTIDNQDKHDKK